MGRRHRGVVVAIVANLLGGTSYVLTKVALAGLTETTLVLVRSVVALAVLAPLAGPRLGALVRAPGRDRRAVAVMGVAGYALPLVLASYGIRHSTATNASLLIGFEPLGIVVMAAVVLGEPIGRARVAALALGIAGAMLLVANGIPFVTTRYAPHPLGDGLLVAAALAWAPYSIAGKTLLGRHDAIAVSAAALVVALPFLAAASAIEMGAGAVAPRDVGSSLAAAVFLGLAVSAGMTVLWNTALGDMDASRLAGFVVLQPLAGVALGTFVLGEQASAYVLAGGALVLAGVAVLVREEQAVAAGNVRRRPDSRATRRVTPRPPD